ncbi:MAG: hypothetical protein MUP70_05615 [Candidatus Aminicenantes bacterium]|nr:hypothetical protein [Candidatus Aminicenantes bacterium]
MGFKPYLYFGVSWLVPGLGHYLLKKKEKAVVFFSGIILMVGLGLLMKGEIGAFHGMEPIHLLDYLGSLGNGLLFFVCKALGLGQGDLAAASFHYGSAFITVAGFLNLLIAVKAFGLAKGENRV